MFQGNFKGFARKFLGCFKVCFKTVSRMFQGRLINSYMYIYIFIYMFKQLTVTPTLTSLNLAQLSPELSCLNPHVAVQSSNIGSQNL